MLAEGSAQDRCINERFPYLYQSSPQRKEWPEQAGHQGVHRFTPPARSGFAISHICAVTFLTELLPPPPRTAPSMPTEPSPCSRGYQATCLAFYT